MKIKLLIGIPGYAPGAILEATPAPYYAVNNPKWFVGENTTGVYAYEAEEVTEEPELATSGSARRIETMIETDEFDVCPNCGAEPVEPEGPDQAGTLISSSSHRYTFTDWGPGEEWTEMHKCQTCGTVYSFQNGYP